MALRAHYKLGKTICLMYCSVFRSPSKRSPSYKSGKESKSSNNACLLLCILNLTGIPVVSCKKVVTVTAGLYWKTIHMYDAK